MSRRNIKIGVTPNITTLVESTLYIKCYYKKEMVIKRGKHQRRKRAAKIYIGRHLTLHMFCFILNDYRMHEVHNREDIVYMYQHA